MYVRLRGLISLILLVLIGGCASVHPRTPTGTGTYSYLSGRLAWTYPVAIEAAWLATLQALEGLNLQIQGKTLDGLGGRITALRADKTGVFLELKPMSDRTTRISVQVGNLGNRQQSEDIHDAIRTQLQL